MGVESTTGGKKEGGKSSTDDLAVYHRRKGKGRGGECKNGVKNHDVLFGREGNGQAK